MAKKILNTKSLYFNPCYYTEFLPKPVKSYPILDKIKNSRLVSFHIYNLINPYTFVNKPKHTDWLACNKKVNVTNACNHILE